MIKRLMLEKADRIYHLPPQIDEFLPKKGRKKMLGREVLDLARFKWPERESGKNSLDGFIPASDDDIAELKSLTSKWYMNQFGTRIKPNREIFIGGSVRQILNLAALAFFNPGDVIMVPDPGVWHYRASVVLASAETVPYHLTERNRFKPVVSSLNNNIGRLIKAMVLNSPHNPTGATLSHDELGEILRLAGRDNIMLILDHVFEAFGENDNPVSFYSLPGGRKVALELYSFSYNFGRPLPSIGFAIGQAALINGLKRVASSFGYRLSRDAAKAATESLVNNSEFVDKLRIRFNQHREILDQLCQKVKIYPAQYRNGPFYWAKLPGRKQSLRFSRQLYLQCGILAVPGHAFGENGEGYLRFSLTSETSVYEKALAAAPKFLQMVKERKKSDG